jgi:kumamolisin
MAPEQHVQLPGSNRAAVTDADRIGEVDPDQPVTLTIGLRGPALPDADDIPRVGLTAEEFAQQYGAAPADAELVRKTLTQYGFTVDDVSLSSRTVDISGTVGQMQAAFRPQLALFEGASGQSFRGRQGTLSVPADLKDIVTGVFGVDERRVVKPRAAQAAQTPHALKPSDFVKRYRFPDGDGAGERIAIAEFAGGFLREDITAYCHTIGVPDANPNITTVDLGAHAYTLDELRAITNQQEQQEELDATVEVMMDVQIVAGLCPAAEILVYFAPFSENGWVQMLKRALADRPVSLSISWGTAERNPVWSHGARNKIDELLNSLALEGVTVCVSSGDDGSGDLMFDDEAHVDYPASSAFVLGVGGTKIVDDVEQAWWDKPGARYSAPNVPAKGGGASGGGVSEVWPRPKWQNVKITSVNKGSTFDGRVVPDVAALAGLPLYFLTLGGQPSPNGGTSASTPLWAALIARVQAARPAGSGQRFLTPMLYQTDDNGTPNGTKACKDITTGHDNASTPDPGDGYAPDKGYDAVTGWGVPDGGALLTILS